MLSLLNDNGNLSNLARIILKSKRKSQRTRYRKVPFKKIPTTLAIVLLKRLMYSPIPIPQTLLLLFLYIFLEKKRHMKVLQNLAKENKN